ncbi:LOW QUALITY PROTEIN: hypothetical protein V2J09_001266 [Rumex salicifolius]
MAVEEREPLLENSKEYYESCSECRVERRKESEISVPFKKLFAVWIRDFHFTEREENISYYAGSAFTLGRALTSIFWGKVADRYGRKPVIIIGSLSVVVFNTLFSVNFWMAITTRFLLGGMNGLFRPFKAYATKFCREEHQALALSVISSAWSIGLIIGPYIGGFLAQPVDKYLNLFSKESLLGRFPYFLPCLCISLFAAGVSISTFWLEETLHKHPETALEDNSYKALESANPKKTTKRNILKNWQLMSTLPVYCISSFHDMAYSEIFSLWSVSPQSLGGLGYSTEVVGEILTVTGLGMLLSQFFAFPYMEKLLGPVTTMRVSALLLQILQALSIPLLQCYPFIALLSGLTLQVLLNCASVLKNIFCIFSLWSVSPKSLGGLGYSTEDVGEILSITGFGMLLSQFFAFPYVEKFLGPVMTMRVSSALSIPLLQSYPFIALLSGLALKVLLNCASVIKNIFCTAIVTSIFILQNRAVDQDQRGAANGIAMTVMSFSKTIGPACGGALLSWSEKRQGATFLPGCQIVYSLLNVTQLMGLILTFKPFLPESLYWRNQKCVTRTAQVVEWRKARKMNIPSLSRNSFPFGSFHFRTIRDFHIAEREEDISYYAASAVMFGRGLTSMVWGVIADRYGRKPVIIISTISVVVFNTLFGLSVNYWMAIATRFLLGCMNGLIGPMKAYSTECCREEHQALALSTLSTAWSIGLIIGPAIGGLLAQPAVKYPNIFSEESFFGRFPYFLPCLCISVINVGASIFTFCLEFSSSYDLLLMSFVFVYKCINSTFFDGCCLFSDKGIWQETLHKHKETVPHDDSYEALESAANGSCSRESSQTSNLVVPTYKGSILKNWPLMSTFPVYCIFSFHDMAYSEIFSLWAVSPKNIGGLGYSTEDVGEVLSITGFGLLFSQLFAYPYVQRILGPVLTIRISGALSIPLLQSYPFIAMLSGLSLRVLLIGASTLKNAFASSIFTSVFILQNRAVDQDQRGAANGIAMTVMAISKTIAPACGGALLSWAERHQYDAFLPGSQIVYSVLNVTVLVGLILTFKPFLAVCDMSRRNKDEAKPELADLSQES